MIKSREASAEKSKDLNSRFPLPSVKKTSGMSSKKIQEVPSEIGISSEGMEKEIVPLSQEKENSSANMNNEIIEVRESAVSNQSEN